MYFSSLERSENRNITIRNLGLGILKNLKLSIIYSVVGFVIFYTISLFLWYLYTQTFVFENFNNRFFTIISVRVIFGELIIDYFTINKLRNKVLSVKIIIKYLILPKCLFLLFVLLLFNAQKFMFESFINPRKGIVFWYGIFSYIFLCLIIFLKPKLWSWLLYTTPPQTN